MNRFSAVAVLAAGSLPFTVGCATKNYVRNQTTPIINNVNELDDETAKNTRDIKDVDTRAQQGIAQVNDKSAAADQKALAAGQSADQANQNATQASNRVTSLAGTVENLDNYKPVQETAVQFGFDKAELTRKDKQTLDDFAANLQGQRHYIIQVEGYTDSTGPADYNYQLSQRRADAVANYLQMKYNIPPHKFYLVGIGKDQQIASDSTAAGRAKNRRVDIKLLSNMSDQKPTTASTTGPNGQ